MLRPSHHPFDLMLELETDEIRLDYAALHIARDAFPHVDSQRYIAQLDDLANEVLGKRSGGRAQDRFQAMREVLIETHGFRGNADDYYEPANSYLNRVLDRRVGIPISLAVVWLEVSRRLRWPVRGVSFPGHFLVRFDDDDHLILADVFHDGRTLSVDDCKLILAQQFERKVDFSLSLLNPADNRTILQRMLVNLRELYRNNGDSAGLRHVLSRLVALNPDDGRNVQELATLEQALGDTASAADLLSRYLSDRPDSVDAEHIRRHLHRLQAATPHLN